MLLHARNGVGASKSSSMMNGRAAVAPRASARLPQQPPAGAATNRAPAPLAPPAPATPERRLGGGREALARSPRPLAVAARASKKDDSSAAKPSPEEKKKSYEAMLAQLRQTGLNQEKARRLLKAWAKAGALEPEQLKRLLVRRSLAPARALGVQAAIDLAGGVAGFVAGSTIGQSGDFPGKIVLEIICYFGAMWYAISGFAGGAALAQVLLAARRYAASADALLAAVQQLAGPEGVAAAAAEAGPGALAANVALAVNTAKVVAALDAIAEQLRAMDAAAAGGGATTTASGSESDAPPAGAVKRSTLINLSAYLTVQHAEEKEGFRPSDYGLTEREATDIAAVYSQYDTNENFVLDLQELSAMCSKLGRELSRAEVQEAARIMTGGAAGGKTERGVTFPQFVAWWTGKGGPAKAA